MLRLVALSDTHYTDERLRNIEVPEGDVLIHAGDATFNGKIGETARFMQWLEDQPHRVKIFVPGNHDFWFEANPIWPSDTIRVITNGFYKFRMNKENWSVLGCSYVKDLPLWAFNKTDVEMGDFLASTEPHHIDILVTHMPPYGILDYYPGEHTNRDGHILYGGEHLGSWPLKGYVKRTKPKVHIFGHIHEGHGCKAEDGTVFANVAVLNKDYEPTHDPTVITI